MAIIKGTTPTIKFTFSSISSSDISAAYLTIKQGGRDVIQRDLTTAVINESSGSWSIDWTLTQEETLGLSRSNATIYCDWKLRDGTRGRSAVKKESIEESGINEVI